MTHLSNDVLVREADYEAILRSVVLALVLHGQPLPGVVVGLPLATALELRLETLEVGSVLHHLDESHSLDFWSLGKWVHV